MRSSLPRSMTSGRRLLEKALAVLQLFGVSTQRGILNLRLMSAPVQVFGRRRSRINPHVRAAGVGKAPRQEIAVGSSVAVRRALWGFSRWAGVDEVGQKQVGRSVCCKPRMVASG